MNKQWIGSILLATLVLSGCASPTPQVDIGAKQAALEQLVADWREATNQEGVAGADGWTSFITEDATVLPPNAEGVKGRAAAHDVILQFTAAEDWSIDWKATSIKVAADGRSAYGFGSYEFSLKDAAGNPVSDKGKWLDIFEEQQDGSWKASVVMWNSDLPVVGAEEPTTEQ